MIAKIDPLDSWHALQARIHELDEKELEALMDRELKSKKRRNMVIRIHMKLNKVRYAREKAELVKQTVMVRAGKAG